MNKVNNVKKSKLDENRMKNVDKIQGSNDSNNSNDSNDSNDSNGSNSSNGSNASNKILKSINNSDNVKDSLKVVKNVVENSQIMKMTYINRGIIDEITSITKKFDDNIAVLNDIIDLLSDLMINKEIKQIIFNKGFPKLVLLMMKNNLKTQKYQLTGYIFIKKIMIKSNLCSDIIDLDSEEIILNNLKHLINNSCSCVVDSQIIVEACKCLRIIILNNSYEISNINEYNEICLSSITKILKSNNTKDNIKAELLNEIMHLTSNDDMLTRMINFEIIRLIFPFLEKDSTIEITSNILGILFDALSPDDLSKIEEEAGFVAKKIIMVHKKKKTLNLYTKISKPINIMDSVNNFYDAPYQVQTEIISKLLSGLKKIKTFEQCKNSLSEIVSILKTLSLVNVIEATKVVLSKYKQGKHINFFEQCCKTILLDLISHIFVSLNMDNSIVLYSYYQFFLQLFETIEFQNIILDLGGDKIIRYQIEIHQDNYNIVKESCICLNSIKIDSFNSENVNFILKLIKSQKQDYKLHQNLTNGLYQLLITPNNYISSSLRFEILDHYIQMVKDSRNNSNVVASCSNILQKSFLYKEIDLFYFESQVLPILSSVLDNACGQDISFQNIVIFNICLILTAISNFQDLNKILIGEKIQEKLIHFSGTYSWNNKEIEFLLLFPLDKVGYNLLSTEINIKSIISGMGHYFNNPNDVKLGLKNISKLIFTNEAADLFINNGGMNAIIQSLKCNREDNDIISISLFILYQLTQYDEFILPIRNSSVWKTISIIFESRKEHSKCIYTPLSAQKYYEIVMPILAGTFTNDINKQFDNKKQKLDSKYFIKSAASKRD